MTLLHKLQNKYGVKAATTSVEKLYMGVKTAIEDVYPDLVLNDHLEELIDDLCTAADEANRMGGA